MKKNKVYMLEDKTDSTLYGLFRTRKLAKVGIIESLELFGVDSKNMKIVTEMISKKELKESTPFTNEKWTDQI